MGLSDGRGEIDPRITELADVAYADIEFPSGLRQNHEADRHLARTYGAPLIRELANRGMINVDAVHAKLKTSTEGQSNSRPFEHHVIPLGVVTEGRRIPLLPGDENNSSIVSIIFGPVDAGVYGQGRAALRADLHAIADAERAAYTDSGRIIHE